jgi:demethylmenaquinone methyltransferase/2-methoxy-6-polyprenyl-1,4-benzoquinol methylase
MVTAVDASLEMIEINRAKVSSDRVSYLLADLFSWQPERIYDAIFFGFWISHVPLEQLDTFLHSIVAMLRPKGKVFFADSQRESTGTTANRQLPEQDIQITNRTLNDGRSFEIIKNFYNPNNLANRCSHAGLDMIICETNTHFLYGYGFRR